MNKKIAVIGTGPAGLALANGFKKHGYNVILANRAGRKVQGWDGEVFGVRNAVKIGDIIVLAIKGTAAEGAVENIKDDIAGKTIIDVTNPLSPAAPENGILRYFTNLDESLMEKLQKFAPEANFVKAFNSVGAAYMVDPIFDQKPTMFICGNNKNAKKEVSKILEKFGWEPEDMGMVQAARAIEPLCILWCIPGILNNNWSPHAFKLLKAK